MFLSLQLDPLVLGNRNSYRWWEEDELKDICKAVGLQGFERTRQWRFIMFTVKKPE